MLLVGCRTFNEYAKMEPCRSHSSSRIKAAIDLPELKNRVFDEDSVMLSNGHAFILVSQHLEDQDTMTDNSQLLDISPERFMEMVTVISYELKNMKPDTKVSFTGYPRFTILDYQESGSLSLKLLTAFFMGIPCLLGVPANSVSTYVEIQTEWLDDSGKLITSHTSHGYNKTYMAMYWGYGADARKRSNMLATQEALISSRK